MEIEPSGLSTSREYEDNYLARARVSLREFASSSTVKERRIKMIKGIFAPLLATLLLAGVFGTLAGCNTMAGAGQDIEQGGKAIKDEAKEQKRY
jgi:predicted small secreted protein